MLILNQIIKLGSFIVRSKAYRKYIPDPDHFDDAGHSNDQFCMFSTVYSNKLNLL